MEKESHFFIFCFCLFICFKTIATAHANGFTKLFVFGDSYVDTGNRNFSARSWNQPYGITLPGKPAGHYSNGRVFSDYIASWMGIRSPTPYRWRKMENTSLECGMNFAFGGTGVFDTLVSAPNMTIQIDLFQRQLQKKLYTKVDLNSSIALVSLAGNDYTAYLARNGTTEGLSAFTKSMIKQLGLNLQRIHGLGVRKIAVMNIQPLGCLPSETISDLYKNCSTSGNSVSLFHNQVLEKTVEKLNNKSKESVFVILNMYKAFLSALKKQASQPGTLKFKDPLRPCCEAVSTGYKCGNTEDGKRMYVVCNNPNSTFFWDDVHPSQAGWRAVYLALKSSAYSLALM
ncbi:GDSL esterase/lipase At5g03610-like isoform X2 [Vitis riparia]|uniref:GDSL esterase/lipase At5g03610-like isoform X2 n=1 Tax=Vitis riparia TaxID=96939 RepID=UPI00155A0A8C|nr:GDSL esterase/lipase At5g03610-like isoform X2 [Vitis riparia]